MDSRPVTRGQKKTNHELLQGREGGGHPTTRRGPPPQCRDWEPAGQKEERPPAMELNRVEKDNPPERQEKRPRVEMGRAEGNMARGRRKK